MEEDVKLREFWIRFNSSKDGGATFPEPVVYSEDPKLWDNFSGVTIHVREVPRVMSEEEKRILGIVED